MEKSIFTNKEAAEFLRISEVTLWRERSAGNITYRRLGGRVVYTEADLVEFLERNKQAARVKAIDSDLNRKTWKRV